MMINSKEGEYRLKRIAILLTSSLIVLLLVMSTMKTYSTNKSGQEIFLENGCASCHEQNKGDGGKIPSKQHMANLAYNIFKDCIKNGRPGTAMKPKALSNAEIKAIHNWVQKYK